MTSADQKLPAELTQVSDWLQAVFPEGISEPLYSAILPLLSPEFSDRQLTVLISHHLGLDYGNVLNDIYRAVTVELPDELLKQVDNLLRSHGFPAALKLDS